jgi:hypothetical protein
MRFTGQQDGLYHQQQSILRNGGSSTNAFLQLYRVMRAWRSNTHQPVRRSIGLILLCVLHITAFALAGIFSSRITQTSNDVLIQKGQHCGFATDPSGIIPYENFTSRNWIELEAWQEGAMRRDMSRFAYTRTCYAEQDTPESSPCLALPSNRLSSSATNSTCPFAPEMCRNDLAMQLDSGFINSNMLLGINAPPQDQVSFRLVTTWAPLAAGNYTTDWIHSNNSDPSSPVGKEYYFGPQTYAGNPVLNYTFGFRQNWLQEYPFPYFLESV